MTPIYPIPPNVQARIAQIEQELDALDVKRIRPLAEDDPVYLAKLTAQVLNLRDEMKILKRTP